MGWLDTYSKRAALTDRFIGHADHARLIAAGLFGEAGSVVAELKKMHREGEAYPAYRHRIVEELGDFLWYYVRLVEITAPTLLGSLGAASQAPGNVMDPAVLPLELGRTVGSVLNALQKDNRAGLAGPLQGVWRCLNAVAAAAKTDLETAARANLAKTESKWPTVRSFHPLFDDGDPPEEQIPRDLTIEFLERSRGSRVEVLLRCKGLNIGDRITDNIEDPDGYRYHDIFHLAYAVFLGWSPVSRALLRCKRKSKPSTDENQDGARAGILEEAVSAIVFSRAKNMKFFAGATQVDFDLLKNVQEFVKGYEVETVPLWQWEMAILEGYRAFRELCEHKGGQVSLSISQRSLKWSPLASQ
jgi:hypothetical protein